MRLNGAQILWECLVREGVDTVFGITGGAVLPIYHELPNYPIRHITMRHEQACAHAADGYARATGRVGVWPRRHRLDLRVTGCCTATMDLADGRYITGVRHQRPGHRCLSRGRHHGHHHAHHQAQLSHHRCGRPWALAAARGAPSYCQHGALRGWC